jgi:hypothetical protein
VWQAVYEELRGGGLEIIAVAFDTAGKAAVEAKIRAADCGERPEVLARLMGWSEELWAAQAPPTYPCLIDEGHVVGELYGMYNVPQAVWIDESGHIVRPAETAGATDMTKDMNRETFEIPDAVVAQGRANRNQYIDALRDWVRNGAESWAVLPADEIKRRLRGPSEADVSAATHVRLGQFFYHRGALDQAKHHLAEASRLCPEKWNYRRQSNMLDPQSVGELNGGPDFFAQIDALSDLPFYPVAEFSAPR